MLAKLESELKAKCSSRSLEPTEPTERDGPRGLFFRQSSQNLLLVARATKGVLHTTHLQITPCKFLRFCASSWKQDVHTTEVVPLSEGFSQYLQRLVLLDFVAQSAARFAARLHDTPQTRLLPLFFVYAWPQIKQLDSIGLNRGGLKFINLL